MLPMTNCYWFRESYLYKFCLRIICEERKQTVLILNSSEKLSIFFSKINMRHVHFNMVNSKHRYCRCLLIKICRPYLFSLFTKICQMKSCQKWNVHFCSFETGLGFRVSVIKKGIINNYFFILLMKNFFPEGQAVKSIFFAPSACHEWQTWCRFSIVESDDAVWVIATLNHLENASTTINTFCQKGCQRSVYAT